MSSPMLRNTAILGAAVAALAFTAGRFGFIGSSFTAIPGPSIDESLGTAPAAQTAVLAGGCFWGMQAVFEHVNGVTDVTAGYAGGQANTASYEQVETGDTGHAESVRIVYDPSKITYGQLLQVYFSVAHDPTELDRQGPDVGTQYRSSIFYTTPDQKRVAEAYIQQLERAKTFKQPIVTTVVPLQGFYPAEAYHQDYFDHHPDDPYIVINDRPKVKHLEEQFPKLYREARVP